MSKKCPRCGRELKLCLFHPAGSLCEHCEFELNPPKMRLVQLLNAMGQPLYNMTSKVYEGRMTIQGFESCGWFLRRKKISPGFIFYNIEFFGKIICARFSKDKFPSDFKPCPMGASCTNQMVLKVHPGEYLG